MARPVTPSQLHSPRVSSSHAQSRHEVTAMPLLTSVPMLGPPRRWTDTLGSTNTPPNSWAPGRAVRFFPPHLRATLSALLECAKPVCNLHGWAFVT